MLLLLPLLAYCLNSSLWRCEPFVDKKYTMQCIVWHTYTKKIKQNDDDVCVDILANQSALYSRISIFYMTRLHFARQHHEIAAALCSISSSHFFAKYLVRRSKCDDGILNICPKTRLQIISIMMGQTLLLLRQ